MISEANQTIFSNWSEYIQRAVENIIEKNLEGKPYDELTSTDYIKQICQQVIEKLSGTNKNFKYITNCILASKSGKGLDMGGLSYWNADLDGSVTVKWESKAMTCIVIVHGVSS